MRIFVRGSCNASFLWLRESSACVAVLLWQDASLCKENARSVLLQGTTDVHRCPALAWSWKRLLRTFLSWRSQGVVIAGVGGVRLGCCRAAWWVADHLVGAGAKSGLGASESSVTLNNSQPQTLLRNCSCCDHKLT